MSRASELGAVLRRPDLRWTVVVVVLAIAGVVALWPSDIQRSPDTRRAGPAGSTTSAPQVLAAGPRTAPTPDDAELADVRQRAELESCPTPPPGWPARRRATRRDQHAVPGRPGRGRPGLRAGRPPGVVQRVGLLVPAVSGGDPGAADYAARPGALPVIGINVQDRPADALDLLTSLGVHYPSVTDPNAALLAALHSPPVLPLTYVLRPDGSVTWVNPPVVFRTPDEVADRVARLIGPPRDEVPSHG